MTGIGITGTYLRGLDAVCSLCVQFIWTVAHVCLAKALYRDKNLSWRQLLSIPRHCDRKTLLGVRRRLTAYGAWSFVVQPVGGKDRLAATANLADVLQTQMVIAMSEGRLTVAHRAAQIFFGSAQGISLWQVTPPL